MCPDFCDRDGYLIEQYTMRGAPGFGISDSSTRGVLEAAGELCREGRWPIDREEVIALALMAEWDRARGRWIGIDDVVPIVHGGALEVRTLAPGTITATPIAVDAEFVRRHLLSGFNPGGQRHHVPDLLESLFTHPRARAHVAAISKVALAASAALHEGELDHLASCVRRYMRLFCSWSGNRVINRAFAEMAWRLETALGKRLWAVKPPGAGGAESLVALLEENAMGEAQDVLAQCGWSSWPVTISQGLTCHLDPSGRWVRFAAPHRIDLVGAADLGLDPSIAADGVCCSLAIDPLCELWLTFLPPNPVPIQRPTN
jgi:hypothetical protein